MKCKAWAKNIVTVVAPFSMVIAGSVFAAPEKVRDFGLIDHLGDQYQISRLGYHKAVVLISQANSCNDNIEDLHRYKLLRTTWEPLGVKFLMVNSDANDSLQSIRSLASVYDINFPIMYDETQLVAESLKLAKAGELLVIDPASMNLVYRGPLDKQGMPGKPKTGTTGLADALDRVVNSKDVAMETVSVPVESKCDVTIAAKAKAHTPDYATEVAPIFKENCAHCHVEGGIGPFAMNSYEMVRGWAPMIREAVMTKRMPPAQVDPTISHFDNANYLDVKDTQTLIHWIDAGAPRGTAGVDPLLAIAPIKGGWQLDTPPDLVVDVPSFTVPSTGVLDYFNNEINLGFDEDRYVKAVQFIPGDKRVLHHLLAYISTPNYDRSAPISEENIRDFLEGYAPGKTDVTVFPENTGVFIEKGHLLIMQMHYTTFGKEVVDNTKVALWFHDKKPEYKFLTKSVSYGGPNIALRPNEAEHAMNAQHVFEHDTMLYSLRPHMHYRGKSFKFTVIYPDGRREVLLNVPNYNFAWQPTYRLSEPKFLPAGSRVINDGVFDNSKFNPGNPDPNKLVRGGAQSWDEMFIGYYTYINLDEGKEKLTSK